MKAIVLEESSDAMFATDETVFVILRDFGTVQTIRNREP